MPLSRAEIARRYRQRHPEKARATNYRWRENNKERFLENDRAWRKRNREALNAQARERASRPENKAKKADWRARNKERIREIGRAYKYGLLPGESDRIFASQGKRCAICSSPDPRGRSWHVDHDHVTRVVRGILCKPCNHALGAFGDNVAGVRRALDYLERANGDSRRAA